MKEYTLREYSRQEYIRDLTNMVNEIGLEEAIKSVCDSIEETVSDQSYLVHMSVIEDLIKIMDIIRIYFGEVDNETN